MKNLSLKTQGVRGATPKFKEKVGYISAIYGEHGILVDNFKGAGESYQQREIPNVIIVKDGKHIFEANLDNFLNMVEKQDNTIFSNYINNKIVGNRFDTESELANKILVDTGISIFFDENNEVELGQDFEIYGDFTIDNKTYDITLYYIQDNENKMYITDFDLELRTN